MAFIPEKVLPRLNMPMVKIVGLRGSGKTLLLALLALLINKELNFKIKSNFPIFDKNVEYINPLDLLKFELEDTILVLAEAHTILNSRNNPQQNKYINYFITQTRHRGVTLIYDVQLGRTVDLVLDDLTEITYVANRMATGFYYMRFENNTFRNPRKDIFISDKKADKVFNYYGRNRPLYDGYKIILPIELLQDEAINFDEMVELSKTIPTKQSFCSVMKKMYPFKSVDDYKSMHDLLKAEQYDLAKKLIGK